MVPKCLGLETYFGCKWFLGSDGGESWSSGGQPWVKEVNFGALLDLLRAPWAFLAGPIFALGPFPKRSKAAPRSKFKASSARPLDLPGTCQEPIRNLPGTYQEHTTYQGPTRNLPGTNQKPTRNTQNYMNKYEHTLPKMLQK